MIAEESIYIPLLKNIKDIVAISESDIHLVMEAFKPKTLSKKEILLFKGDQSNHMRFIADGCLRSYYINEEGQEYIL